MHFVHILVVIFGLVYVDVAAQQLLNPQGKSYVPNKEIKQTEKNKTEIEHANSEQSRPYIGNLPKPNIPEQKKEHVGVYGTLIKKANDSQGLNTAIIPNQTVKANNGDIKVNQTLNEATDELTTGAISRGILVFVVLSLLFILYVGIKTCRRKSRDKRSTIVKKYGVRARRSDVEMEPLPLSDDDEDETVFDLTASRGNNF